MAEFKISSLRFNYLGQWQNSTVYNRDALATYRGKTYVCLTPHTSGSNDSAFYDALFFESAGGKALPYWQLVIDGHNWAGPWDADVYYNLGDIISYGGTLYLCTTPHLSTTELDLASFTTYLVFTTWNTNWDVATNYGVGDVVKFGGIVYICTENHISAASLNGGLQLGGLEADIEKWDILYSGIEYKGTWSSAGLRYKKNDLVKYGPDMWICLSGNVSSTEFDQDIWEIWLPGEEYVGTWDIESTYQIGDVVSYGGYQYFSITANNSNNIPSTDPTNWELLTLGYKYSNDWAPSTPYKIGDLVRLQGSVFVAVQDNSAQNPVALNLQLFYTELGSSGTILEVDSTSGVIPGLLILGSGFTLGQTVVKVLGPTTLQITQAPDNTVVDGQSIILTGINYAYWSLVTPGVKWQRFWQSNISYSPGDLVIWKNGTYKCITTHSSNSNSRPDNDVNHAFWINYALHARNNALASQGDLLTFSEGETTSLTIGNASQVLQATANSEILPKWKQILTTPRVYYVATNGTDRSDYGITWDQPWKTIAYACQQAVTATTYSSAVNVITNNKEFLVEEMYQWMLYQKSISASPFSPSSVFDETKTKRDAGLVIDALLYDLSREGNSQTVAAALSYFAQESTSKFITDAVAEEMPYFIASLTQLLSFIINNLFTGTEPTTTYQELNGVAEVDIIYMIPVGVIPGQSASRVTLLMSIILDALTNQTTAVIPTRNDGTTITINVKTGLYPEILPIAIPANTALVGDELRGVTVTPKLIINTFARTSSAVDNTFTVDSTEGMYAYCPVQFVETSGFITNLDGFDTTNSGGPIVAGQTYYILGPSITPTKFSVSANYVNTIAKSATGTNIILKTTAGMAVGNSISFSENFGELENNVEYYILTVGLTTITVSDDPEGSPIDVGTVIGQLTDVLIIGPAVTLTGSYGFMQVVGGDALSNMFYMHNGTGVRNMTLKGLLGTLTAENSYFTRRPTGGAYISFDPGTGPDDSSTWIIRRSPYLQNISLFGVGCTAMKVDGDLHNGGYKSMTANDFTCIISDGIGAWMKGTDSKAELISVFTYYNYTGYFAEDGGRIRAANGNCSYGSYGAIAEGYDVSEIPITATVNNRTTPATATVQSSFGIDANLLKISYSNAGQEYYQQTTNLLLYSNGFTNGAWVNDGNVTIQQNLISPDGLVDAWTLTGITSISDSAYVRQNISITPTGAIYNDLAGSNITGSGSGALFDVTVNATSYSASVAVSGSGGSNYVGGSQIKIYGSQVGGIDGTNDITLTVASVGLGSRILTVTAAGTVPAGSAQHYTFSIHVKQGTASEVDIYAIYSGVSTKTSHATFNFNTETLTVAGGADGGGIPSDSGVYYYTNDWYRIWFTLYDVNALNNLLQFRIYPRSKSGVSAYTRFYGAQVERGNEANFYLSTTTGRYSAYADYLISGAGAGAVIIADELRSKSIYESRITDPGSGAGGSGYLTASNNAQGGTTEYIVISGSDINTAANYNGMRLFINSGTGSGQFGFISYYDEALKIAYMLKESVRPLAITASNASSDEFTLSSSGNVNTLYLNQPVQFIPTYYSASISTTSQADIEILETIGGTTNTITVDSTAGLYYNMAVTFSGQIFGGVVGNFIYYVQEVIDETTFRISSTSFGNILFLSNGSSLIPMYMNIPSNTDYLKANNTASMIVNMPIQFTGVGLGGISLGTIYYINDVINGTTFTISSALIEITITETSSVLNKLSVASTSGLIPMNPIVLSGTTIGGSNILADTKYYISKIYDSGTFSVSSTLITVDASATAYTSGLITVTSTSGFISSNPIKFNGLSFGNLVSGTTYYILAINDGFTFTVSETPGGAPKTLTDAVGLMTARTCPTSVTLTSEVASTMIGTTTNAKYSLTTATGTMNAIFSTPIFGGVEAGTTYYIKTITAGSPNKFKISETSGGSIFGLTSATGNMLVGELGWDNINPGTEAVTNFDSSTVYYIEPRITYSDPEFSQSIATLNNAGALYAYVGIAYGDNYWIAVANGSTSVYGSSTGASWTTYALPTTAATWSDVAYGDKTWVVTSTSNDKVIYSSSNGASWKVSTMPTSSTWSSITYGLGNFVAVATGTTKAAYSTDLGATWNASTLPGASGTWSSIAYGKGLFITVASSSTRAAYSTDNGVTWIASTLPGAPGAWSSIAYGNGRFVAVASTSRAPVYSFDGITWYTSNYSIAASKIEYGQGVFLAVKSGSATAYTSEDGLVWINRSVNPDSYGDVAFGFQDSTKDGVFVTVAGPDTGSLVRAGALTKCRPVVNSGIIESITEWEPGSNYQSVPTLTIFDPNVTTVATISPRIGNGTLGPPTFISPGAGFNTSSTFITINGSGFADQYQVGLTLIVNNLTQLPRPGDDLTLGSPGPVVEGTIVYKVTNATILNGTTAPNLTAAIQLSPPLGVVDAPEHATSLIIREKYSQVRLTNHDFLNIGYGDEPESGYPGFPVSSALQTQNQIIENNYGRVFYTSTDQDGNFKVGNLFGVEQATGIITLSASQFGLTGLETLSLGGIAVGGSSVVVTQFSTDSTFVSNSDAIIPTQKAIKSYLGARLSQGGSNTLTGQTTAGTVVVGGPNLINSTLPQGVLGSNVKMLQRVNFVGENGQIDGNLMALDFFMKNSTRRANF